MVSVSHSATAHKSMGYEFTDCGSYQRFESFGGVKVVRSCSAAVRPASAVWPAADLTYDGVSGRHGTWRGRGGEALEEGRMQPWTVDIDGSVFELFPAAMGQIGVFPEQRKNWTWIREILATRRTSTKDCSSSADAQADDIGPSTEYVNILNAFAYTGGSTLAALSVPGVRVVHLDASKTSVRMARRNALLSGLDHCPVRWLVDDCMTFVKRESVRNRGGYRGLILDPPAFGKGGGKKTWKIDRDLPQLMQYVPKLLSQEAEFVLLTCHDLSWPEGRLGELLDETLSPLGIGGRFETGPMNLQPSPTNSNSNRRLDLGSFARWSRN